MVKRENVGKEIASLFDSDNSVIEGSQSVSVEKMEDHQPKMDLSYKTELGRLYLGDSIEWMKTLEPSSVDLIFADPPYNIKKAEWDSFESDEEYIRWSALWISEASRILKSDGTMFICGFSEILANLRHPASQYFSGCRWIVWHYKNKANLGNDWGRSHESIMHLRKSKNNKLKNLDTARIPYGAHTLKYPSHPQAESSNFSNGKNTPVENWTPHPMGAKPKDVIDIPTLSNGMPEKTPHPTQKPEELIRRLLMSSSLRDDLVLDPFSGSGTTAVVAEQTGRRWLACDLSSEYNGYAISRLDEVKTMSDMDWFNFDRAVAKRRESIR